MLQEATRHTQHVLVDIAVAVNLLVQVFDK